MRFAILLSSLVTFVALPAVASPTYPGTLADQLELECAPACVLCHNTMEGGPATANRPVGIALRRLGLMSGNPQQLLQVIAQLEANGTDSDGDGQGDVAELRAGNNPNDPGSEPLGCYTEPAAEDEGGCTVQQGARKSGLIVFFGLMIWAMVVRRRRSPRNV